MLWMEIYNRGKEMSFEGYYQCMCKNGHYWTEELQYSYAEDELKDCRCYKCNEEVHWWNLVDTTNGLFDEEVNQIDGHIYTKINNITKCKHCNSALEIIFYIPQNEGHLR